MNIKGISIGNPAISLRSYTKNNIYAKFALKRSMISTLQYIISGIQSWVCSTLIDWGFKNVFSVMICGTAINLPLHGRNRYDYTTTCKFQPDCYDFSGIKKFLEQPAVQQRLHSEGKKWVYTSDTVNNAMLYDNVVDYSDGFAELLQRNISVTLYYGEKDYICNYEGGLKWLPELKWGQHTSKLVSQKEYVLPDGVGTIKGHYLFNFATIHNAGHFVTMDRPEVAPVLMRHLVGKGKYQFHYSKGVIEVAVGAPEQKLRLLVSTGNKVSLSHPFLVVRGVSVGTARQGRMQKMNQK